MNSSVRVVGRDDSRPRSAGRIGNFVSAVLGAASAAFGALVGSSVEDLVFRDSTRPGH